MGFARQGQGSHRETFVRASRTRVGWRGCAGFALAFALWPAAAEPAQELPGRHPSDSGSHQQGGAEAGGTGDQASVEQAAGGAEDAPSEAEAQTDEVPTFVVFWDQGLHLQAPHRNFTLRLAGSAQNDSAAFSEAGAEPSFGEVQNGVQWRRVRVLAEGVFARYFDYRFQYDFAQNAPPNLKDAYLGFTAPVLPLRIYAGRFRTPLGLEGHTSGMDTTFMERGLISAFLQSRNTGLLFYADEGRQAHNFRYAVGAIKPEDDFGIGSTDKTGVSMRFSYAFQPGGDVLVHAGADYTHRPVDETVRFLERPESNIAPQFVDTGTIAAKSVDTGVFEFALVKGPWSFQSEGAITGVNRSEAGPGDPFFWGAYGFVSYMVSGEHRPYQTNQANFGRVLPADPFLGGGGGRGAFEVAFRVSYLDLEDQDVLGGRLLDLTWAFNWYATRNARVLTNVIWADPRPAAGSTWIAQVRLQWAL